MSTPQSIPRLTPRSRITPGTALIAVGVLLAIVVTITFLALTGTNHTTLATPVTASQAASGSTPQTHYLGPRQQRAVITAESDATATAPAAHHTCLGTARSCLR